MQQNESSTLNALTITFSSSSVAKGRGFRLHWAWDVYAYTFATLFGIFALSCFAIVVRQCKQPSSSRNVHGRFTTIQLFIAATLKVVVLLWSPLLLNEASKGVFTTALLIDCCSTGLILSAFSILLLILLETTKTFLASPRFQNIWVLVAITAVLTTVMLTFNLLVLYADRKLWYFLSYVALFIWGTLICIGYVVAGRRMWRNLQSSREISGKSSGERRLKNITIVVFLAPFITAAMLILNVCLAAAQYGIFRRLEMSPKTFNWSRYVIMFLLKCCKLVVVVLIFVVVIRTKSGNGSVDNVPSVQLGTFEEETPIEENWEHEAPSGETHNTR